MNNEATKGGNIRSPETGMHLNTRLTSHGAGLFSLTALVWCLYSADGVTS